jgi:hypothetical protein
MIIARQSTARTMMVGPVLDASGVAVTDCVVADFEGSVNGGDPAALNGSATLTHRGVGFYSLALTATDLGTVGQFEVTINDTVNCCAMKEITVVEEAVYDAFYAASALGYVANAPVNVAQISGDSTAADNLENAFDDTAGPVPWTGIIDQGTLQSASASTAVLRSAAAFVDDGLNGCTIVITNGTQIGERALITDYVGATDTATVTWPGATPSGTPTYKIYGSASGSSVGDIADAVWDEALSGHTTAGTAGKALSDASSAGDPWSTAVPGAYAAGTAGSRIGRIPDVAAGAATGLAIAGSNAATTYASLTVSGATTLTGAVSATNASNDIVGIDVAKISGDATAANNAESFFDGTGYAGTGNTIPTVTTVNGLAANVITAAATATDFGTEVGTAVWATTTRVLTAATNLTTALATPTNITAGTITTVSGNVTGSVGSVASGGITAASIATGAIDADALATDAVTEIEGAVWAGATRTLTAATNLTTALATPTNITAGTITTVSGNVAGSVGSVATGGITAASIATGAVDADALAADGCTKVAAAVLVAAAADPIDANIEQVNTVVIQGVGTSGDKWRPV